MLFLFPPNLNVGMVDSGLVSGVVVGACMYGKRGEENINLVSSSLREKRLSHPSTGQA